MPNRPKLLISPDALRSRRLEVPLTREELATSAGVSIATVKALEAPTARGVNVTTLRKIARALGCDAQDISLVEQEQSA